MCSVHALTIQDLLSHLPGLIYNIESTLISLIGFRRVHYLVGLHMSLHCHMTAAVNRQKVLPSDEHSDEHH